ncbi:VIT1/CCC1 transporter family protein [Pseudarthrobacter sp. R1]|uniref:VIT1/CCC1 transporter family protein n=1 Tax=Pseudarthrobacter sp. R1 TaxID=2944934 RepID=UPI0027E3263F|nr:VIT1/CCC1 transporter family protein [Pseudarthrobacter sp. R1]
MYLRAFRERAGLIPAPAEHRADLQWGGGEYISVQSQRELLEASTPNEDAHERLPHLNVNANECALLYRARGMTPGEADAKAAETLQSPHRESSVPTPEDDKHEAVGTGLGAAMSSFLFFASGAILPVIPYLFGLQGITALIVAGIIVGLSLLATGAIVALLSGGAPLKMALRQLAIGYGAAAVTYLLGMLFGTSTA